MGNEGEAWQTRARCRSLSPSDSDAIFFPTVGGKSNKARSFCSLCPVQGSCLMDALETKLDGFFSGTTPQERVIMADMYGKALKTLDDVMPPEPVRKATVSRYRKVVVTPDPYSWMDEADPRFVDLL